MKNPNQQSETPLNHVNPGHNPAPCQTALDCYVNDMDKINPNDHKNNHKEKIRGQSTPFNTTQSASQRIPFENPEAEAYWNRPCRHGKYPYPDENIFLVGGAKFLGHHLVSLAESTIIVSLTPQLAQEYWVDIANDARLKSISCFSLAQAKTFQSRLDQLMRYPAGCVKIKSSLMNALFFKSEIFWVVGTDAQGGSIEKPVQATSVKEILTWTEQENLQVAGVLPAKALQEMLREMKKVQQGAWEGHEHYAYDYAHAEDLKELDIRIATRSLEEQDEDDEDFLMRRKDDPDYSKEEYEQLVVAYAEIKEKRHLKQFHLQGGY